MAARDTSDITELGLRNGDYSDRPTGKGALIDALLEMLSDSAPEADGADTEEFRDALKSLRTRIAATPVGPALRDLTDECIKTCERYFGSSRGYHKAREAEMTEMIGILRSAAALMVDDSSEFHTKLLSSSERFSSLSQLDDIRELRRRLGDEVSELRTAVETKQKRDEEQFTELTNRVTVLQQRLSQAEAQAAIDALTGIANRGGFDRALRRMTGLAKRNGTALSLAMVDVDNFKTINDRHGHPVGDRILVCAAQWLGKGLRQTDIIARYGGEEFAIILEGAKASAVESRLTDVLKQIAQSRYFYEKDGTQHEVRFTVSCGVAEFTSQDTDEDVVKRADEALYEAKRKGKNRVIVKKKSLLSSFLS